MSALTTVGHGRKRPPRPPGPPAQTIPEDTPPVEIDPQRHQRSRYYPENTRNFPDSSLSQRFDVQRSNSTPNVARDGAYDHGRPALRSGAWGSTGASQRFGSDEPDHSAYNTPRYAAGRDNPMPGTIPKRAGTFASIEQQQPRPWEQNRTMQRSGSNGSGHSAYSMPKYVPVGDNPTPAGYPRRAETFSSIGEQPSGSSRLRDMDGSNGKPTPSHSSSPPNLQYPSPGYTYNPYFQPDGEPRSRAIPPWSMERSPQQLNHQESVSPRGSFEERKYVGGHNIGQQRTENQQAPQFSYPTRPEAGESEYDYLGRSMQSAHMNRSLSDRDYGSNDALSIASRTTGERSIGSGSTASEHEDLTARPAKENFQEDTTCMSIYQEGFLAQEEQFDESEEDDPFSWLVCVWQDGQSNTDRLRYRVLLFDTQCENSNWVSESIINDLGATMRRLSRPAQFTTFSGDTMTADFETTLSFRRESHKATRKATFLVAATEEVPFDMVLGAAYIRKNKLLDPRTASSDPRVILGLANNIESKTQKKESAARIADHEIARRRQLESNKRLKEGKKKREQEEERRNAANSSLSRNQSWGQRESQEWRT